MNELVKAIEDIQARLPLWLKHGMNETSTGRNIVDPLLEALGWDAGDPEEFQFEYRTVDGKPVDYALKINRKPVLLVEAKPLRDPLDDPKAMTQIVGYASSDGVEWCILTNGLDWRVFSSTEKCPAPDKLLFEVSIDPKKTSGISLHILAEKMWRFSREEMARGTLDKFGEKTFTDGKVRKALDQILRQPPNKFIKLIREHAGDERLSPSAVKESLAGLTVVRGEVSIHVEGAKPHIGGDKRGRKTIIGYARNLFVGNPAISAEDFVETVRQAFPDSACNRNHYNWYRNHFRKEGMSVPHIRTKGTRTAPEQVTFEERHHISGKPQEVVELYHALDRFCLSLEPGSIDRNFMAKYVRYSRGKRIFCSIHLQQSGLRLWLTLKFAEVAKPPRFARDVSHVGHWGTGDVELDIATAADIEESLPLIRQSFEAAR